MRNFVDYSGRTYNRLTVLKFVRRDRFGKSIYLCRCICGTEKEIGIGYLTRGTTKSCGCKRSQYSITAVGARSVYNSYKSNAKIRKLSWLLTFDEARNLFEQPCYYCGAKPSNCMPNQHHRRDYVPYYYNGIDRYDNILGYISSNCVACCWRCNSAKSAMSGDAFIAMCHTIANRHIKEV